MKSKWSLLVAALIAIVAVFFASKNLLHKKEAPVAVTDPYLKTLEEDKVNLKKLTPGKSEDDKKIYGAMIRLGETRWVGAKEAALKFATSESTYIREGSAQALGYFSDSESNAALEKLLTDKEATVRDFALKAIGRNSSPERTEILKKQQQSVKENSPESLALLESEFRLLKADGKGEEQETLKKILQIARGHNDISNQASLKLIELAPQWENTVLLLRTKVEEKKDPGMTAAGIRYLAGRRDPWLKDKWNLLARNPQPTVRKAVIQSLHRSCPSDRESIMLEIAKDETDPTVQEVVIDETKLLAEPWGAKVMDTLKPKIKDSHLIELLATTNGKALPPCAALEKETKTR